MVVFLYLNKGELFLIIITIFGIIISFLAGTVFSALRIRKVLKEYDGSSQKNRRLFLLALSILECEKKGNGLCSYFKRNGYKDIAIYGMGELGLTVYELLSNEDVNIKYCIDKRANELSLDIPIICPDEIEENVDAIVITTIGYYEDISKTIREKTDCPIITIDTICQCETKGD